MKRTTIYILILLAALVVPFLYKLRADNIFACQASGYTSDRFLTICEAANYGDYEHGAFWFDLEPAAEKAAAAANVLLLGDSRMQFAFSTAATQEWFSSASANYYLLGFYAFENSIFERALLHKLKPRPEVYIIAIGGDYFQPRESPLAKSIMNNDAARTRYEIKRLSQFVHKAICMKLPKICGHSLALFRSRQTGTWYMPPTSRFNGHDHEVSYNQQIDEREIDDAIAIGRIFLSELPVRPECVILTAIPTVGTKLSAAKAVASSLGKMLVVPEHLDGLKTFDEFHLDQASAERWSEGFFAAAGPQIQKCLKVTSQ